MTFSKKQINVLIFFLLAIMMFNVISISYFELTGEAIDIASISFYLNGAPYLSLPIPNQTWQQDRQSIGIDLDDHFTDPDGDPLNYTSFGTTFVSVYIDPLTHVVTLVPQSGWWGIDYVWFNATDPYGATGMSNRVTLNVTPTQTPGAEIPGGGGGGRGRRGPKVICFEQWVCKDWTACINGIQTRTCRDLAHCGTNNSIPAMFQKCHVPSCSDRIQNQNETGLDCGGPCPPCKTCFDGVQNCHAGECETGLDCGGPCLPCELSAIKDVEFLKTPWISLVILLIVIFSIEAYLYATKRKLREQQLPLSPRKMREAAKKLMQYMNIGKKKDEKKP